MTGNTISKAEKYPGSCSDLVSKSGFTEKLTAIVVERGCGRLEWWCLDRNKPSIDFYLSLGAEPISDWTVYRIAGDTLTKHAK